MTFCLNTVYLPKDKSHTSSLEISLDFGLSYSGYEKNSKNISKNCKPHSTQNNERYTYINIIKNL